MLDREENEISAYEKLKNLIGLKIVKEQIDNIIAADIVEKERKKRNGNGNVRNFPRRMKSRFA